eukprot:441922-Prymnesium_polylepis.1
MSRTPEPPEPHSDGVDSSSCSLLAPAADASLPRVRLRALAGARSATPGAGRSSERAAGSGGKSASPAPTGRRVAGAAVASRRAVRASVRAVAVTGAAIRAATATAAKAVRGMYPWKAAGGKHGCPT